MNNLLLKNINIPVPLNLMLDTGRIKSQVGDSKKNNAAIEEVGEEKDHDNCGQERMECRNIRFLSVPPVSEQTPYKSMSCGRPFTCVYLEGRTYYLSIAVNQTSQICLPAQRRRAELIFLVYTALPVYPLV